MPNNTLDSNIVPDTASQRVTTVLGTALAPLGCFNNDFSDELIDPTRPMSIPIVLGTGDAQETPTNFEIGDSQVGSEKITPVHISKSFHITQAELNSGHRLEKLFDINLRAIAHAVMDRAMAPITTANFGAAHIAATPEDLDVSDLRTIWGDLSNNEEKNMILNGAYFAQQLPSNRDNFELMDGAYNFDKFRYNNRFEGAEANVVGIACNPNAMAMASRLPTVADSVANLMLDMQTFEIPELGMSVQFNTWANTSSRQAWASFDVCFGAVALDKTPGIARIIKSQ